MLRLRPLAQSARHVDLLFPPRTRHLVSPSRRLLHTMDAVVQQDGSKTKITTHNQYSTTGLHETELTSSPMEQFEKWFQHAVSEKVAEPEAMTLSTTTPGPPPRPSARVVLLKQIDSKGFLFFSNYASRKGGELEKNPYCALTFFWQPLSRSVRVCGRVERLTPEESKAYFDSRPLGSRIGAWASPQSTKIENREQLENLVRAKERELGVPGAAKLTQAESYQGEDKDIPLPDYWGGYRVVPDEIEFWAGRPNRLHDRFRYTRDASSSVDAKEDKWQIDRLAP